MTFAVTGVILALLIFGVFIFCGDEADRICRKMNKRRPITQNEADRLKELMAEGIIVNISGELKVINKNR